MSGKYCFTASSIQLFLFSYLSLCLFSGSCAQAGFYIKVNNAVFTNRAWVPNEPRDVQTRSAYNTQATRAAAAAAAAAAAEQDLQRPQEEPNSTGQQSWNGQPNAEPNSPQKTQQQQPNSVPKPSPTPPVTVHGVDIRSQQAEGQQQSSSSGPARPPAQYNYRERFSSTLFQPIARNNAMRNVVYSPASMHSMMGLLYGASSGQTSDELQRAGQFGADKRAVAVDFQRLGQLQRELVNAQLIVANKLFYNRELSTLNDRYENYARTYFSSEIEGVNMRKSVNTAAKINDWASRATRSIIRELVSPSDIDEQTEALMVNAIYFKARWATEFSAMDTTAEKFRVNGNAPITVPMMYNDDIFPYVQLPELDATALELPYAGTEASMLIILPNQPNGLQQLEQQLANPSHDLNVIASRLRREMVTVRLPKFRIEFEQDMSGPLQEMGVRRMFSRDSQVDAILMKKVRVSKILQKAFIDVNEAGSEAAAASYAKFVPLSLPVKSREFIADHPFIFAIRTPDTVLFIGHVVQPLQLADSQ